MHKNNSPFDCSVSKCNNLTCYNSGVGGHSWSTPSSTDSFITSRSRKFLANSNESLLYMQGLLGVNWGWLTLIHIQQVQYSLSVCTIHYASSCIILAELMSALQPILLHPPGKKNIVLILPTPPFLFPLPAILPPTFNPDPPICMVCSLYRVNLDESRENFVAGKWYWNSGP